MRNQHRGLPSGPYHRHHLCIRRYPNGLSLPPRHATDQVRRAHYCQSHPRTPTARHARPPGPHRQSQTIRPPSRIGGQMILISNRWSHYANNWYADPTQRRLLTGITISKKHSKIRLLSSYWPVPHASNQHSHSLHAHVVQYIQQHNPLRDSPDMDQHHPSPSFRISATTKPPNHPTRRPELQLV
jgi:hypothetical protein